MTPVVVLLLLLILRMGHGDDTDSTSGELPFIKKEEDSSIIMPQSSSESKPTNDVTVTEGPLKPEVIVLNGGWSVDYVMFQRQKRDKTWTTFKSISPWAIWPSRDFTVNVEVGVSKKRKRKVSSKEGHGPQNPLYWEGKVIYKTSMSALLLHPKITTPTRLPISLSKRPRPKQTKANHKQYIRHKRIPLKPIGLEIFPNILLEEMFFILISFPQGFHPSSTPDGELVYELEVDITGELWMRSRAQFTWGQSPIFAPLQIPKSFLHKSNFPEPDSSPTFEILVKAFKESIFPERLDHASSSDETIDDDDQEDANEETEGILPYHKLEKSVLLDTITYPTTYTYGDLKVTIFDGTSEVKYLRDGLNPQVQIVASNILSRGAQEEAIACIYAQCKLAFPNNLYLRRVGDLSTKSVMVTGNTASISSFFASTDKRLQEAEVSLSTAVTAVVRERVLRKRKISGDNEEIVHGDPNHGKIWVYLTAFTDPELNTLSNDIKSVLEHNPDAFFLILDFAEGHPSKDRNQAIRNLLKEDDEVNHVIIPLEKLEFGKDKKTKIKNDLIQAFLGQIGDWLGFVIARMGQQKEVEERRNEDVKERPGKKRNILTGLTTTVF